MLGTINLNWNWWYLFWLLSICLFGYIGVRNPYMTREGVRHHYKDEAIEILAEIFTAVLTILMIIESHCGIYQLLLAFCLNSESEMLIDLPVGLGFIMFSIYLSLIGAEKFFCCQTTRKKRSEMLRRKRQREKYALTHPYAFML